MSCPFNHLTAFGLRKFGLNLDGVLGVHEEPLPGAVLLVDDIVGSRWTFTVAAWLLRRHGSGEVWPLALSSLRGS